ncbi:MAG TPA: cupin domain-containing protein [Gaiellaceae bacterium]|nr:cupin domain-containing protein [Gaiellaceae bacterium]
MRGGPVWGAASADLNATVLEWPAGGGPGEHVNEDRDVLYAVLAGSVTLTEDGESRELEAGAATIVDKGVRRALVAGPDGARYLTAHIRRGGLEIERPRRPLRAAQLRQPDHEADEREAGHRQRHAQP